MSIAFYIWTTTFKLTLMYTGVVIVIGFRSVVSNLLLTLQISSESFHLEIFRIAILPLLFDLSQWHASTFAGSILTSSFDKTVNTFPSSSPSPIFSGIPDISRVFRLECWALLQHWRSSFRIRFLSDSLTALVIARSDSNLL